MGVVGAGCRGRGIIARRRALAVLKQKLGRDRAALEAGADPAMVAEWTRDVRRSVHRLWAVRESA